MASLLKTSALLLTALGSLTLPLSAIASPTSQLTIEIDGLKNRNGQICLSLFNNGRGFPDQGANAVEQRCVSITEAPVRVNFNNLQWGNYAVAVLHDVNGDGKANRNFLGIPTEGFGFSNNPRIRTSAPNFNDTAVAVAGTNTNIQIRLRYLLGN
ncbi:MAG TPA: DUF2141 domain-containing protein [Trichocoleus sp.]|jgi:uncharacterized protein (DUF2141 family)